MKEHTRGNEILVIDSDAFAANQLEFNWGEVSVKEISQIELATKRKNTNVVGTKENEIKWDFGEDLSKEIEEESILDSQPLDSDVAISAEEGDTNQNK